MKKPNLINNGPILVEEKNQFPVSGLNQVMVRLKSMEKVVTNTFQEMF